jgi:anhydro-N-acetylmuramic acid kinase
MIYLGLMSGTSLDGLDAVFCTFKTKGSGYKYDILFGKTLEYDVSIRNMLQRAPLASGIELIEYDRKFGHYLGKCANKMIALSGIKPDVIASHGHTVFHRPENGFTFQLGHGAAIAAECGLPVMYDFRSMDVALGGQGAPLVPIGDKLLFPDFAACLNMGGFANVSMDQENRRIAWDICPVNFVANHLAALAGYDFDCNGFLGKKGTTIISLLEKLENLDFYRKISPKSLGREWVENEVFPLLFNEDHHAVSDLLRTFYEHISLRIASDINLSNSNVLCTGGGVKNHFLMQLIRSKTDWNAVVSEETLIDFKEALIFAFLAFLKRSGKSNCLASVTGASRDSSCGSII